MLQLLQRWFVRGLVLLAIGGAVLGVVNRFLPSSTATADFKFIGGLLTAAAAALVLVDVFWGSVSRKLDEALSATSVLTARQRSRWREDALAAERDAMACFVVTVVFKVLSLAIGALLTAEWIPGALCLRSARVSVFLMGMALPMLLLMPLVYFAARRARIALAAYEETEAERLKVLDALSTAPAHDFGADPYYAEFGREIAQNTKGSP